MNNIIDKVPETEAVNLSNFCDWFFEEPKTVSFINPVNYFKLVENEQACRIDSYFFDGILAQMLVGFVTKRSYQRISFDYTSLAPYFFEYCEDNDKTIYVLGAKECELLKFLEIIHSTYPGMKVLGWHNGYFSSEQYIAVKQSIRELKPDVVICGLGCPKQEEIAVDVRSVCSSTAAITCGGFIHQTQNKLQYYPWWINRLGLRMPYRFLKEPHTRNRIYSYPRFILHALFKMKGMMNCE